MAGFLSLSQRDMDVLGKIRDPESSPSSAVRLDPSLPKDPHITDGVEFARISAQERDLLLALQQADMQLSGLQTKTLADPLATYRQAVAGLDALVAQNPSHASARNNRAQALRRLYGDDMLLQPASTDSVNVGLSTAVTTTNATTIGAPEALLPHADTEDRAKAAATVLSDLDRAIALLMPPSNPFLVVLSPTAAKTLSLAFTQRAAVYHATAKQLASGRRIANAAAFADRFETRWTQVDWEEAASRDFAMGGRFGNDIARGLAVGTNPTAKLCGQMVQQMMRKEYGGAV